MIDKAVKVMGLRSEISYSGQEGSARRVEIAFAPNIDGTAMYIIEGGVTGNECIGVPVSPYAYNQIIRFGWIAYAGVAGATDKLFIPAEEMRKVLTHFEIDPNDDVEYNEEMSCPEEVRYGPPTGLPDREVEKDL